MGEPHTGWRKTVTNAKLADCLTRIRSEIGPGTPVRFVCVGTDRSTGDAFGPLVGSSLYDSGFAHVIGTLERPCDASNLSERLAELPASGIVIGIDASVGAASAVGSFTVARSPVWPGRSLGKALPGVGDYAVTGIVAENRANPYAVLQTASLYAVMNMARTLAQAVELVFGADERQRQTSKRTHSGQGVAGE